MVIRHSAGASVVVSTLGLLLGACGGDAGAPPATGAAGSAVAAVASEAAAAPASEVQHPGKTIFETTCFACHSIGGGPLVGPDLKDVHLRRDRDWLVRWIKDPIGMGRNDPIGQQLLAEWNNVPMAPTMLNDDQIDDVLDYILGESEG